MILISTGNSFLRTVFGGVMLRAGQNHIYTPYMTVYLVDSMPKIPSYTVYICGCV